MKNMKQLGKKSQGFTLIEVMIAVFIIGLLTLGVKQFLDSKQDDAKVNALSTQINAVAEATRNWKPYTGQYTGVSMEELQNNGLIPEKWATGTGITAFGGDITVAVSGSDSTQFVITASNILNTKIGARLVRQFTQTLVTTPAFAGDTVTLTFPS